jgi:hypothetical protein
MPFIQFPFIEVPKELLPIVGEPTPGTRAYRREGTHKECGEWFETSASITKETWDFRPTVLSCSCRFHARASINASRKAN